MASLALKATLDPTPVPSKDAMNIVEMVKQGNGSSISSTENNTPAQVEEPQDDWYYPHPTTFKLSEVPIDKVRELKVAVIGAGLSGTSRSS